ncbi:hypothetical protein BOTBODRAFT_192308 [Botryobasidium botryosum FD-172 SS1]|uniref:Protein kinase domain-containing protein n=1 Tax=Botryobasidium botryosum (strain FD-172 SS1) TaxID=930990 RepID=A0A067M7L0_BOTB1|nr:hypothetical protein BOTBODRAFT_192308 [Botryobasidium botryosum FD-172 SS1]
MLHRIDESPEDEFAKERAKRFAKDGSDMNPSEASWIAHQPFMESCACFNIMMDAKDLCKGYHPQRPSLVADASNSAVVPKRHQVPSPKHYFIDFGVVQLNKEEAPMGQGTDKKDKAVPELKPKQEGTPPPAEYNAFLLDIYILGNMYKSELLLEYQGLSFLTLLIGRMTAQNPSERPSAAEAEALELLQKCQKRLFPLGIYRPLVPMKQSAALVVVREVWYWSQRIAYGARRA